MVDISVSCWVSCSLPIGNEGAAGQNSSTVAWHSYSLVRWWYTQLPKPWCWVTHGKGVGSSKVHGAVATCESRQSISRMRMCMQMGDSEDGVGTRGRRTWHGMAWHDTPWLGLTGAATCMHACVYVYASISGSQPAPKCDHRKVASDTMCWVACLQTDDAAGARRK